VFCVHELTVYCCFIFCCCCFSFCCRGLFVSFTGTIQREGSSPSYAAGRRLVGFLHHHEMLLDNLWSLYTTVRVAPQAAGFCRRWRFDFLAQNYELLQSNNCLLGCERVMETWAEFHFSWVYTFSAMLSSLRNRANHDRYRLRPSTPAQLCWSSSRLQPLQNKNLIKFAIIRPSTLNHGKNLWNCRGAPDETTCLTVFFRCPSALALICVKLFNVCANKLSLSKNNVELQFCVKRCMVKNSTLSELNIQWNCVKQKGT